MIDAEPLRRIWLCADDYGISPGVNRGIRELIEHGRLNATSVMVVGPAVGRDEVAALQAAIAKSARCAIGLHATLTAPFRPLTMHFRPLDGGMFNRAPDFVDGHQHVQLYPQLRDGFLAAVKEKAPGAWVRQARRNLPLAKRLGSPKALLLDYLSTQFRRRAAQAGVAFNPAFSGAYDYSREPDYGALMRAFLDRLPEDGVVMCHPGFVDEILVGLDPLTVTRETEFAYLAGEDFPRLLAANKVTLT